VSSTAPDLSRQWALKHTFALRAAGKKPDIFFGAREGVIEAAFHGIDCVIVIVDEEFTDFLKRLGRCRALVRYRRPALLMKILVQPAKGSYKLLFYDGKHVAGVGIVDMTETPKGPRPVRYRLRWGSRKDYQATPSKDLISQLRESEVRMVKPDAVFEEFMKAFQIRSGKVEACRMCLLDDRYTPINDDNHCDLREGRADLP